MDNSKFSKLTKLVAWLMLGVIVVSSLTPLSGVTVHANETSIATSAASAETSEQEADSNVTTQSKDRSASATNEKASDPSASNAAQANAPNKEALSTLKKALDTPSEEDVALTTDSETVKHAAEASDNNGEMKSDTVTITVPTNKDKAKSELDAVAKDRADAVEKAKVANFKGVDSLGLDSISVSLFSTMNLEQHQHDGDKDWAHWVEDLKEQAGFSTWSKEAQDLFLSGNVPVTAYYVTNKQFVEGKSASDGFRLLVAIYSGAYAPYMSESQRKAVYNNKGFEKYKDVEYVDLSSDLKHLNKAWDLQNEKANSLDVLTELAKVKSFDKELHDSFAKDANDMKAEAKKVNDAQANVGIVDKLLGTIHAHAAADNVNNWSSGNNWRKDNDSQYTYVGTAISNNTMNSAVGNGYVLAPNGKWYPSFCIASSYDTGMSAVRMAELFSANSTGAVNKFSGSYFDGMPVQYQREFNNIVYFALQQAGILGPYTSKPNLDMVGRMDILGGAISSSKFTDIHDHSNPRTVAYWTRDGANPSNWIAQNWTNINIRRTQTENSLKHADESASKTLTIGKDDAGVDTGIKVPSGRTLSPGLSAKSSDGTFEAFNKNGNIWVKPLKDSNNASTTLKFTVGKLGYGAQTGTTPIAYYDTGGHGQMRGSFVGYIGEVPGWTITLNVKTIGKVGGDLVKIGKWDNVKTPWTPTESDKGVTKTDIKDAKELGMGNRSDAIYQLVDRNRVAIKANDSRLANMTLPIGTRVTKAEKGVDPANGVYFHPANSTDASKNGHIRVENLLSDHYAFKEVVAPKGYQIDSKYHDFGTSSKVDSVTSEDGILTFGFNGSKVIGVDGEQDLWIGENGAKLHLTPIGGNVDTVNKGGHGKTKYTVGKDAAVKMPDGSVVSTSGDAIVTESKSITIDGKKTKGGFEFRGVPAGAYMLSTTDATEGYLEMTNLLVIYTPTGDGGYQFTIGTFSVDENGGKPIYTMSSKPIATFNSKEGDFKLPTQADWDKQAGVDTTNATNRILNREVFVDLASDFNILDAADHRKVEISTRAFDKETQAKNIVDVKDAEVTDRIYIRDNEARPSMVHKSWKNGDRLSITAQPMLEENSTAFGEAQHFEVKYDSSKVEVNPATGKETPYVDVTIKLDASKIPGKKVVMYESVKNLDDKNDETNKVINESDITNTGQTVIIDEHPSIDIEKSNGQTPDAGNGNHFDKDDNIKDDHDTSDDYYVVENGKTTEIYFGITNNGSEDLKHVFVDDVTIAGSVAVGNIVWTHNDKVLSKNEDSEFINEDGSEFSLPAGDHILGKATLPALPSGELHGDSATVNAVGAISGKPVGDDDRWHGKTPLKPQISTQAQLDGKDTNNFAIGDKVNLGDRVNLTGVSTGTRGEMKFKLWLVLNGKKEDAKVVYESAQDITVEGDSHQAIVNKVFDTTDLKATDHLVWTEVFEGTDLDGEKVTAEHNDLDNKNQTLTPTVPPTVPSTVPDKPKYSQTGMNNSWALIALGVIGLTGVAVYVVRKRRA